MKELKKKKGIYLSIDLILVFVLIFLDQLSKNIVVKTLKGNSAFVIWKGVFELDYLENRGSAFGLFENKKIFLLCVGVIFMVIMCFLLWKTPADKKYMPIHLAAVGIIAGGIGNMIDRFVLGYVVDFFSFVLIHYPIFNVADIYIVVSTILMAVLLIFVYKDEELTFLSFRKEIKD